MRRYDVHGTAVEISGGGCDVAAEMHLRLGGFAETSAAPELRFEFTLGSSLREPSGEHRPIYDTRDGTIHYYPAGDELWGELGGVRMRCAAAGGLTRIEAATFEARNLYHATHPLATIALMEMFKRRARYCLHAACVTDPQGRGVLLAGPAGAGKSTLTIALARSGLGYVSDDIVFIERDGERVSLLGFADALGVTEHTAEMFGDLRAHAQEPPRPGFPKHLLRLERVLAVNALASCEPTMLLMPVVCADEPSSIEELDAGAAWLALVPDVLLTDEKSTQGHLEAISTLLERVECATFRSGYDYLDAAALLRSCAETRASAAPATRQAAPRTPPR